MKVTPNTQQLLALAALLSAATANANPIRRIYDTLAERSTGSDAKAASKLIWPFLTSSCQNAIAGALSPDSELGECLHVADFQAGKRCTEANTEGPFLPPAAPEWDLTPESASQVLNSICSTAPCSDDVITSAIDSITSGCYLEFTALQYDTDKLQETVLAYKTTRDIVCLKTDSPYGSNGTSSGYCATSLYGQYTAAYAADPNPIETLLSQADTVAQGSKEDVLALVGTVFKDLMCVDCVYAVVDIVEIAYPQFQTIPLGLTITVNGWLDDTCQDKGLSVQLDGTLPEGITETAVQPSTEGLSSTFTNDTTQASSSGSTDADTEAATEPAEATSAEGTEAGTGTGASGTLQTSAGQRKRALSYFGY